MNQSIKTFLEENEKEFDEEFDYMWIEPSVENPIKKDHYFKIYNAELKSFIRQSHLSLLRVVVENLPKELKKEDIKPRISKGLLKELENYIEGYNTAIQELKKLLEV